MTGEPRSDLDQWAQLLGLAAQLEALTGEIRNWSAHTSAQGDRLKLVQYRRQLAKLVAECGKLGEACFRGDAENYAAFRSRFSNMRAQTAHHQAQWTAVSIRPENSADYHRSGQTVHETTIDFIAWLRTRPSG